MWNARLDEAQAGIKVAGKNTNNLRYADDTTLMAESKEELRSLLMKVKEKSEKAGLKLNSRGRMGMRWEGGSKGRGYMYTYGWFMVRFERKPQNSVKQLSFNKKIN